MEDMASDCSVDGTCEGDSGTCDEHAETMHDGFFAERSIYYYLTRLIYPHICSLCVARYIAGGGDGKVPVDGVKFSNLTLWEETTLAVQQLSIGRNILRSNDLSNALDEFMDL